LAGAGSGDGVFRLNRRPLFRLADDLKDALGDGTRLLWIRNLIEPVLAELRMSTPQQ
jgi:hypothetical protein